MVYPSTLENDMTPSSDTLSVLLALPLEARRALCEAEGPGWVVSMNNGIALRALRPVPPTMLSGSLGALAWLPASEGEILRVWVEAGGTDAGWAVTDLSAHAADCGDESHDGTLDSRLRAALECCPRDVFGGGE